MHARRWLALDPLHEPAHRELIRLHALTGDRTAALEQYRACVRTLSRELGVAPLQETAELYEQVNDGTLTAPVAAPRARCPGARRSPRRCRSSCRSSGAIASSRRCCAPTCPPSPTGGSRSSRAKPGIGKTRLFEELARSARAGGAPSC